MLFTIYYICTFLSPSLKAACFPKKIRLKKFAFSIYQQFPKMMSMDFYTRQASQTAHGDCKSRIKLPRIIRISPDRHRQFRVEPPVLNLNHPTACPTSATCMVLGVSGRLRESRTAGGLFRGEVNIYIYFLERIYAQFLGVTI